MALVTDITADARSSESAWLRFWNRGGWWKALLVAAVYMALYIGASQLIGMVFRGDFDLTDQFGTPQTVFFTLLLPIAVGAVILLAFAASVRWLPELFGPQPIGGRGWMWIAPVVVVIVALFLVKGHVARRADVAAAPAL